MRGARNDSQSGPMKLQQKVKDVLYEGRILILGAQILIGLQARAVFEFGFEKLPWPSQCLGLGSLFAMLLVMGVLIAPVCYHGIAMRGEDTPELCRFATRATEFALVPFAIVLGTDLYLASGTVLKQAVAIGIGLAGVLLALFFWFGIEMIAPRITQTGADETGPTPLEIKIDHVLTETRVVLPGVQAILGFQYIAFFSESFQRLPVLLQRLHLAALLLICCSVVLLMTPAAFHRIVEKGEDTERFHRFATGLILGAMVPLALASALEFYVVAEKILVDRTLALAAAATLLVYFYALWFGFTSYVRFVNGRRMQQPGCD